MSYKVKWPDGTQKEIKEYFQDKLKVSKKENTIDPIKKKEDEQKEWLVELFNNNPKIRTSLLLMHAQRYLVVDEDKLNKLLPLHIKHQKNE